MKFFLMFFFLIFLVDQSTIYTKDDIDPIEFSLYVVTSTIIGGLGLLIYKVNKKTDEDFESIKFFNLLEKTPLASEVDIEFHKLSEAICKKLDIKEEVTIKIFDYLQYSKNDKNIFSEYFKLNSLDFVPAFYVESSKTIFLQKEYSDHPALKKSLIIARLVHELEHCCQSHQYSGSYYGHDQKLKEIAADAAAAGFFDCLRCLKIVASRGSRKEKGSFSKEDYACYLQRLQENPKICDGCRKEKQGLNSQWFDYLSFSLDDQSKKLFWQKYSSLCR